jgi:hypothetical protein
VVRPLLQPIILHGSNPINLLKKPLPSLQMIGFAAQQTTSVGAGQQIHHVVGVAALPGYCAGNH